MKKKKIKTQRERGSEKASLQEEKEAKFRQHMFLGRPLLLALGERRDTLTVSCSPGARSTSVEVVIFSRGVLFSFQCMEKKLIRGKIMGEEI